MGACCSDEEANQSSPEIDQDRTANFLSTKDI
jgi:hypothetical protein